MPGLIDAHVHMPITEPIADLIVADRFDCDAASSCSLADRELNHFALIL